MFQSFEVTTHPEDGPPRLEELRDLMARIDVQALLVPRADAHQGEDVAPRDNRLAWLTGFTGSAGFAVVLPDIAGVFVDGRYRVQVKEQVAACYTPVDWPENMPGPWLAESMPTGGRLAFDPWLHTFHEIEALAEAGIVLVPSPNLIDVIWTDRPDAPAGAVTLHPLEQSGEASSLKRSRLAAQLREDGHSTAVLSQPASICWLLNIRGEDIARTPVVQAFALLHDDGRVALYSDTPDLMAMAPTLGPGITCFERDAFGEALAGLDGPVRVDRNSAPWAVSQILEATSVPIEYAPDICALPKAQKNETEISGSRAAHLRDGAAMCEFLAWLDVEAPKGRLTEIDVVTALEGFRRNTGLLRDISFETICGSGPNGAIVHYRVNKNSNRVISPGELLLVDSGGQYQDGTTDITRTIAVGEVQAEAKMCFTRVLQGMIAISRVRFPTGVTGRDLDALARMPLWLAGQDYDHGTGHGVGAYLGVHEGPQAISRRNNVPLRAGMILSNEPGYYREGAFGIRIENLIVTQNATDIPGGDGRAMLAFETLTWVPIDRRLIDLELLSADERRWLDSYHADVFDKIAPALSKPALDWLRDVTAAL
ncbi:aminopeptidase P family protein [Candidatus Halocynthiibacter alkanivorans]|uniref:aminopeptidase P family protein n=1 Tax=Candidatus Halocynthiibacter alkanivorans TaxID=2267619 RepID=UPI000DF35451|nr:aminopeptidase P family protein [Candidatus Halocynthiibacter alkanivorans]